MGADLGADLWAKIIADLHQIKPYLASQLRAKARPGFVEEGVLEVWLPDTGLKTPDDLAKELALALKDLYNTTWQVTATDKQTKTETLAEKEIRLKQEALLAAQQHKDVRKVLDTFAGAEVVDVQSKNAKT